MTTSLRILSLHCALALAATIATAGAGSTPAATLLASDSGWPTELVNRPGCGSDGGYETRPTCEAEHR